MKDIILEKYTIVMYDGSCGFCDKYIQFILDNKPSKNLKFVAQQSDTGKALIQQFCIQGYETSIIVVENHQYYQKTTAILKIMKHLGTSFKYLTYLDILPNILTDTIYNLVSKYRYKLAPQQCRLITKEEQTFFL